MTHHEIPTVKAPTVDAIMEYTAEIIAYNKAVCKQIDYAHTRHGAIGTGAAKRDKLTSAQRAARDAKTMHDRMASRPELAEAYKKMLREYGL